VFLPSGRQRQYSLCGDPEDHSRYRIAVRLIRDGGGGSREIHEAVRAGDRLRIRGPRNAFRLVTAPSYLFLAGGIGITPILPMVKAVRSRGVAWRLIYVGRTRESMPFLDELAARRDGVVEVRPDDEHGGRPDIAAAVARARERDAIYVCGPPPMIDAAHTALRTAAHRHSRSLHSERFSAPPVQAGEPFTIELRRSGTTVEVGARETALAAIRRAVPEVAYSCQQGYCGSCRARVLAGEVDHRDTILDDTERDRSMLICVSRASGRLALDL
jgi:ferredoxin-NADP reductase